MSEVTPVEAVAGLNRVLASSAFRRSPRSRAFLSYVAAEVFAGRGGNLHERLVATRALDKGPQFDGRRDNSVRVQAHRVRAALESYYTGEGRDDDVVVTLPPGSYAPEFTRAPADSSSSDPVHAARPTSVGVVQFGAGAQTGDRLCAVVMQSLAHGLARMPDLRVVGPSRRAPADVVDVARALGVRFVLWGEAAAVVPAGEHVTLFLSDGATGEVVWSETTEFAESGGHSLGSVETWASTAAAHLGDYAGVIVRTELVSEEHGARRSSASTARLSFYRHIVDGGAVTLQQARADLARARSAGPPGASSPDLDAMYAFVLAASVHYQLSEDVDADLEDAVVASREALRGEPCSALAHLALGLVAVSRHEVPTAGHHAREAVRLAPSHPSTLFSAGAILSILGERTDGSALMRRSFALNPVHPAYQHANLAFERLLAGDHSGALVEASIVDEGGLMWGPLCRALALAALGRVDQGRAELAEAVRHEPQLDVSLQAGLGNTILRADQLRLLSDLFDTLRAPEEDAS